MMETIRKQKTEIHNKAVMDGLYGKWRCIAGRSNVWRLAKGHNFAHLQLCVDEGNYRLYLYNGRTEKTFATGKIFQRIPEALDEAEKQMTEQHQLFN